VPPKTRDEWNFMLSCELPIGPVTEPEYYTGTWTPERGDNENEPINCVNWSHAYAFCIWDKGFLPSEAEWNYAATGGDEQRVYPWSNPPGSVDVSCEHSNFQHLDEEYASECSPGRPVDVGSHPAGDARWGHADLAGNLLEWTLDLRRPYTNPCTDCADAVPWESNLRAMRGGSNSGPPTYLRANHRNGRRWACQPKAAASAAPVPHRASD
jgi:formylglycine-generating enzyme required for sulfatase activity